MSGFSFGLVSRLLKNRFQFRFQFCLRAASVSGFQFRFKFHPKKLFYYEYGLPVFKFTTSWRFCFITIISSRDVPQGKLLGLAEERVFTTLLGRVRIRVSTTSKYELKIK